MLQGGRSVKWLFGEDEEEARGLVVGPAELLIGVPLGGWMSSGTLPILYPLRR